MQDLHHYFLIYDGEHTNDSGANLRDLINLFVAVSLWLDSRRSEILLLRQMKASVAQCLRQYKKH